MRLLLSEPMKPEGRISWVGSSGSFGSTSGPRDFLTQARGLNGRRFIRVGFARTSGPWRCG